MSDDAAAAMFAATAVPLALGFSPLPRTVVTVLLLVGILVAMVVFLLSAIMRKR